jgi:hypothetical protein
MPSIDQVLIVRKCGVCTTEIETIQVKKDNMMLSSRALIMCPTCGVERPEQRDIADRMETIQQEQASYPPSQMAVPFGTPPVR